MKLNRIIAVAAMVAAFVGVRADLPFREHRYDSFRATPAEPGATVFAGNSITNMHSWFEAFGSHREVIGRGNSGGFAYELLENLESYIDSKPAKLFVMIGTNDISSGISASVTARRIEVIARRVRMESPDTEIYLQSILPRSSNPKPDYERCNAMVKTFVETLNDPKVHYVNLSEVCAPLNGNATWSHDGLHPRPIGYAAWTHAIADLVGYPTVYPQTVSTQESCGLGGSNAARAEQFPYFPVREGDVLFFGDEQVHGAEWHELLRSDKIKDRGMCWGWGGIALDKARNVVRSALKNQAVKPAKIFLFYGVGGKNTDNYRLLVDEAASVAPEAKIYIVSLTPSTDAATNSANVAFNAELRTIADEKGATYVDVYTPLNEQLSANIMHTNYISGRGYVVMANELARHLTDEGVNAVTLAEYDEVYARRGARKVGGDALTRAMMLDYGTSPGTVKESHRADIDAAIAATVAAVTDPAITVESARAAADNLDAVVSAAVADLNYPTASTEGHDVWYVLTSVRANKTLCEANGALVGVDTAPAGATTGNDVWKFVSRGDNTFDIVNYQGSYINPDATFNTQMTVTDLRPSRGFSLSNSNVTGSSGNGGAFVIYTGNSQLNQTNKAGNPVFSWYSSATPDRADNGCAYMIAEFDGIVLDETLTPTQSGWYEIRRAADNMLVTNMNKSVRQTAAHSYPMQFVDEAEATPASWLYIEVDGNTRHVHLLNGYYLSEYTTNSLTPANIQMALAAEPAGAFNVRYWTHFTIDGTENVVGRSSAKNDPFFFKAVSADRLAAYDRWTVRILANSAAELIDNTMVTLAIPANKSILTVYDSGTFFVTPGTVITPADVTVKAPQGVKQEREAPEVTVENGVITVDYTLAGIDELTADSVGVVDAFDLWGRRVASPRHGIYIVNGRKVCL